MKKTLCIFLSVLCIAFSFSLNSFSAITNVSNTDSNVYDSYSLAYGECNTVIGRGTDAFTSDYTTFWAMTVAGKISGNTSYKEVFVAVHGPSTYTHKIKITTYKSGTTTSISGLSTSGLVSGITDGSYCHYVDKTKYYTSNIICDVQTQTLLSSTSGYRAYPSITVGC